MLSGHATLAAGGGGAVERTPRALMQVSLKGGNIVTLIQALLSYLALEAQTSHLDLEITGLI